VLPDSAVSMYAPTLRYRIADRKMCYDPIASGRAISLSQPTSPPAEGTVVRPLAGDPLTERIHPAWNRTALSERRAGLLYRAAGCAYLDNVPNKAFYQACWAARPERHPVLDWARPGNGRGPRRHQGAVPRQGAVDARSSG
jgi:hypothetical protein